MDFSMGLLMFFMDLRLWNVCADLSILFMMFFVLA